MGLTPASFEACGVVQVYEFVLYNSTSKEAGAPPSRGYVTLDHCLRLETGGPWSLANATPELPTTKSASVFFKGFRITWIELF